MTELVFIRNDERGKTQQNRTKPSLLIGSYGEININKTANLLLGHLKEGKFSFAVDKENDCVFMSLDDQNGFLGRLTPTGSIRIKNKRTVARLMEALEAPPDKSILLYFDLQPIELPSLGKAWRLIKAD